MIRFLSYFSCFIAVSLSLYLYIDASNEVIGLRFAIPQAQKELKEVREENKRLTYAIERFESPLNLIELSRKPEFSHLKCCFDVEEIPLK